MTRQISVQNFRGLFFALCFVAMICLCKDRRCGLSLLVAYLTNARAVLLALNGRFFTPFFTLCFKIYANFAFLIKFLRIFSLNLVLSLSAEQGGAKTKPCESRLKKGQKKLERLKSKELKKFKTKNKAKKVKKKARKKLKGLNKD